LCPATSPPAVEPVEDPIEFETAFDPLEIDFNAGRGERDDFTRVKAELEKGQRLERGPVEVAADPLQHDDDRVIRGVKATAKVEGRDRVKVTACVDARDGVRAGTYTGAVLITDERFETTSIPITVELQARSTPWTVFLYLVLAGAAVPAAALVAETGRSRARTSIWKRARARVWKPRGLVALVVALATGFTSWSTGVLGNETFGAAGFGIVVPLAAIFTAGFTAAAVSLGVWEAVKPIVGADGN